jgi:hypothetical protein
VLDDFGLYPKQRRRLAPEELVILMRSKIERHRTARGKSRADPLEAIGQPIELLGKANHLGSVLKGVETRDHPYYHYYGSTYRANITRTHKSRVGPGVPKDLAAAP